MNVNIKIVDYNNPSIVYKDIKDESCTYPEDLEDIIFGIEYMHNFSCKLVLCMYSYERKTFTLLVQDYREREVKR